MVEKKPHGSPSQIKNFNKMQFIERSPEYNEYLQLRTSVAWHKTEKITTESALSHALYSVIVLNDENKPIGMGRIIGDGGLYFYIQDLIVHPDYQHQGLGTKIMSSLMNYLKDNTRSGSFVGLMSTPGLEPFYNKFNFTTGEEGGVGMYQIIQ